MLNSNDAKKIINENLPGWRIQSFITYNGLYVFKVYNDDPLEGEMDPFYSVNMHTGEFRDFSVITDGDIDEIFSLFKEAERVK